MTYKLNKETYLWLYAIVITIGAYASLNANSGLVRENKSHIETVISHEDKVSFLTQRNERLERTLDKYYEVTTIEQYREVEELLWQDTKRSLNEFFNKKF